MTYQQQQQVFRPEIDYNQALWTAYLNTVNSFHSLEVASRNIPQAGISEMVSHAPWDVFQGNLAILRSMILNNWCDDQYRKDMDEAVKSKDDELIFHAITELLHRRGFFEQERVDLIR